HCESSLNPQGDNAAAEEANNRQTITLQKASAHTKTKNSQTAAWAQERTTVIMLSATYTPPGVVEGLLKRKSREKSIYKWNLGDYSTV
ncbi:hypothetical protein CEXT_725521, partial [Caerostris extrusa]